MLHSVIRVNKKHYPQTLLEECKYEIKKNKMEKLLDDDFDPSLSDNETDDETDSESDNRSDSKSNDELMINLLRIKKLI